MPITHDDLLDILRSDIAQSSKLDERRQAVETYMIMVDTVIKFDSAYEDAPEYFDDPDAEIGTLYAVEFGQ